MKLNPADIAFGNCVKERAGWRCEKCGAQHSQGDRGLDCCHFEGRDNWSTRYMPENCFAFCRGCHQRLDSRKKTFHELIVERHGQETMDKIWLAARDITAAKAIRATKGKGEIAAWYRAELEEVRRKRSTGALGRIDFHDFLEWKTRLEAE